MMLRRRASRARAPLLHGRAEIYKISLRALKNISRLHERSEWVKYFFQHAKRNFVSPSDHVMFYSLYKHQWNAKPFYLKSFFGLKGAVYYEAIAMVIFSHVKIRCYFHMWRYQVFVQKLTWYFIGVYIIKQLTCIWPCTMYLVHMEHLHKMTI